MTQLDPSQVRDISPEVLDEAGRLRVMPASYWAGITPHERALFGHRQGIYSFPTVELVEHLRELIAGRRAIEVGAGHGVLAEALGIMATDNRMQIKHPYNRVYELTGQPPVRYGANVIDIDANSAVRRYKPKVVIGCWVTHKYDRRRHSAGGNEIGINEGDLIDRAEQYVVIGNDLVHRDKEIWSRPHTKTRHPFIFSRATNGTPEFLAVWSKEQP